MHIVVLALVMAIIAFGTSGCSLRFNSNDNFVQKVQLASSTYDSSFQNHFLLPPESDPNIEVFNNLEHFGSFVYPADGGSGLNGDASLIQYFDFNSVPPFCSAPNCPSIVGESNQDNDSSADFDGIDDFLNLGAVNFTDQMTFAAWIKPTNLEDQRIFARYDTQSGLNGQLNLHHISAGLANGKVRLRFKTETSETQNFDSSASVPSNQWTHVVVTYHAGMGKLSLYLNGGAPEQFELSGNLVTSDIPLVIGDLDGQPGLHTHNRRYAGLMNDLYILERTITPNEVTELYQSGGTPIGSAETVLISPNKRVYRVAPFWRATTDPQDASRIEMSFDQGQSWSVVDAPDLPVANLGNEMGFKLRFIVRGNARMDLLGAEFATIAPQPEQLEILGSDQIGLGQCKSFRARVLAEDGLPTVFALNETLTLSTNRPGYIKFFSDENCENSAASVQMNAGSIESNQFFVKLVQFDASVTTARIRTNTNGVTAGSLDLELSDLQTCSSLTLEYPLADAKPVGTCYAYGGACSSNDDCNAFFQDFCVNGVHKQTQEFCYDSNDPDCTTDIKIDFEGSYACGEYVNGDPWIQANELNQVVIKDVFPKALAGCLEGSSGGDCLHGMDVDPAQGKHSLTNQAQLAWKSFVPTTPLVTTQNPYSITVGSEPISVRKIMSTSHLTSPTAVHNVTLTLVPNDIVPLTDEFRPSVHTGLKKKGYRFSDVDLDFLPRLDSSQLPSGGDWENLSFQDIANLYASHHLGSTGNNPTISEMMSISQSFFRETTGVQPTSGYHAGRTSRINASLQLLLTDLFDVNQASHKAALVGAIQAGLDLSGAFTDHPSYGNYRIKGAAVLIAFVSKAFGNDADLSNTGFTGFSELDTIRKTANGDPIWGYYSAPAQTWYSFLHRVKGYSDQVIFEQMGVPEEYTIWLGGDDFISFGVGFHKWGGDAHKQVDGFLANGATYQHCCSSKPWKGGAFVLHHIGAENQAGLDLTAYVDYEKRWVNEGYFAQPDTCAVPTNQFDQYGVDFGPAPGSDPFCWQFNDQECPCIEHGGDPFTEGRQTASSFEGFANSGGWNLFDWIVGPMWTAFPPGP